MGINKNFVVKNGFEVSGDLILADSTTRKVGIGTTQPKREFEVAGGIGATTIIVSGVGTFFSIDTDAINLETAFINSGVITSLVSSSSTITSLTGTNISYSGISTFRNLITENAILSGISTFNRLILNGVLSAGGTTGQQNQILVSTGVGVTWRNSGSIRTSSSFISTPGQTTFVVNYPIGFVDVYINGVKLSNVEFTATNGSTIILDDPCFGNEIVEIISYDANFSLSYSGFTLQNQGSTVAVGVSAINFVGSAVSAVSAGAGSTVYVNAQPTLTPSSNISVGIVTASGGFISVGNTSPVRISVVGNRIVFNVVGIGSTTFTLF
jgi:hypothetical protein